MDTVDRKLTSLIASREFSPAAANTHLYAYRVKEKLKPVHNDIMLAPS